MTLVVVGLVRRGGEVSTGALVTGAGVTGVLGAGAGTVACRGDACLLSGLLLCDEELLADLDLLGSSLGGTGSPFSAYFWMIIFSLASLCSRSRSSKGLHRPCTALLRDSACDCKQTVVSCHQYILSSKLLKAFALLYITLHVSDLVQGFPVSAIIAPQCTLGSNSRSEITIEI